MRVCGCRGERISKVERKTNDDGRAREGRGEEERGRKRDKKKEERKKEYGLLLLMRCRDN